MGIKKVGEEGQMTVEFVVAFPVMIIVAIIAINALLLLGQCGEFDTLFRDSVRIHATSPAYGQTLDQSCSAIEADLAAAFADDFAETSVGVESVSYGFYRFRGTLTFKPTLFGRPMASDIFGVTLPFCTHEVQMIIDPYKPGVLV